ncbi:MAG: hypothetical protein COA42_18955 [Alteromonadaceae bacterium]|nr:MAG: hypothetical protein COA42_18955 [Alteromonadaceae bacterium]
MIKFILILVFIFLCGDSSADIDFDFVKKKYKQHMYVTNSHYCPVTIELNFNFENAKSSKSNVFVLPARKRIKLLYLSPVDKRKPWKYNFSYNYMLGIKDKEQSVFFKI